MTLVSRTIMAVAEEAEEGVAETLVAADTIETRSFPQLSPDLEAIERDVAGGTLTEKESVPGRASGTLEIPMDLAGPDDGDPSTEPTWSSFMKACGTKHTAVKVVEVTGVDTPGSSAPTDGFLHEEILTFAVSTATARCIGVFHGGEHTYLFVEPLTGTIVVGDITVTGAIGGTVLDLQTVPNNGLTDAQVWEPWDLILGQVAIGAITGGPFTVDDLLVGGTSGARARCFETITTGNSPLRFERWLGSPKFISGEPITVVGGAATASTTAAEVADTLPALTLATQLPGIGRNLVGARGNVQITLANGSAAGLTFSMTGKHPKPLEVVPLAGPARRGVRPPKVTGTAVFLNGTYTPCFSQFNIASEGEVALRECMTEAEGYKSAIKTTRRWTASMDPEAVAEGLFPLLGDSYLKIPWRFEMTVGNPVTKDGNAFIIRSDKVQGQGYTPGERARLSTNTIPLKFVGGTRDEFFLFML